MKVRFEAWATMRDLVRPFAEVTVPDTDAEHVSIGSMKRGKPEMTKLSFQA